MLQIFKKTPGDSLAIIAGCKSLPEVEAARVADARLSELVAAVIKIDAAIGETESRRAALSVPTVPEIEAERAELAAKVALGEVDAADLDAFDKRTSKQRAEAEEVGRRHRAALADLDRTLAALRRRRDAAQSEADSLRQQSATVRGAAIRAVAGRLGEQYVKVLETAAPLVSTLRALSSLSSHADGIEFAHWAQRGGWPIFGLPGMAERIGALDEAARPPHGEAAEDEAALEQLHSSLAGIGIRC